MQALKNIEQLDEIIVCANENKNVKKVDNHTSTNDNDFAKTQLNQKIIYESQIKALKDLVNVYEHQILIHLECSYNKIVNTNKDLADGISRSRFFL